MSGKMRALPFGVLLRWMLAEFRETQSIFGIHRSLFYMPRPDRPYTIGDLFGRYLATPIGPAAGPHTQLAQNIVCAWLSGGRFIELKTVQVADDLDIPRPCIDMEDEGYNVEWSQELRLEQSAREYIKAWALVHVLRGLLGLDKTPFGTIFSMSVGYNLEGIRGTAMTRFMDQLADASAALAPIQEVLRTQCPQLAGLTIPPQITNNVTLSTMHGCPPEEIQQIARYLMEERGLHTSVKLNPTLLGKETVRRILYEDLGYNEIRIPDAVFEHDLQYERAVELIKVLRQVAARHGLTFGVKLSNTLAMANHKGCLPGDEMYMSGRALYPITMSLFHRLAREFGGDLCISYSAGADALNVAAVLACGARPVTVASDLLKPGGYTRLLQYLENLEAEMDARGAASMSELARDSLANLERAAADALQSPRYKRRYHLYDLPKVDSGLELFDCITAPCVEQCAVCQDVPGYAWLIAQGQYDRALETILTRNPLPGVTGHVCTHLCQTRCTRSNYEEPVAIRALKRFAVEHGSVFCSPTSSPSARKVAVIGSGPSGLAAGYFLALNGVEVTIYEARDRAGGMLAIAPPFRLPPEVVQADIDRITAMGVKIVLSHPIAVPPEALLAKGFDAVYVACGFARDAQLEIEGIEGEGVYSALDLLERVARGEKPPLGASVLVIGGGNTAMDAARASQRLIGRPVTVVYRRTRDEMPAEEQEVEDLIAEGNVLVELASPRRAILAGGHVAALECVRNELGEPGTDGRRRPVPVEGSEFRIEADSIVVAVGQRPDIAFLSGRGVALGENGGIAVDPETGLTGMSHVYAGGDVARGPAIIVEACADGRRAAEAICARFGIAFRQAESSESMLSHEDILAIKRARARKAAQQRAERLTIAERSGFGLVEGTLTEDAARREAARCLQCSTFCDKCVEVCPNRANYSYSISPVRLALPQLACRNGELAIAGQTSFEVKQSRQILHVDDLCNECGNCATFCVHHGKPYEDKPRLYMHRSDLQLANDNAFYIDGHTVWRREGGRESRLSLEGDKVMWEDSRVRLCLSPDFQVEEMALITPFEGSLSLKSAAEMAFILKGVTASLPFLLEH